MIDVYKQIEKGKYKGVPLQSMDKFGALKAILQLQDDIELILSKNSLLQTGLRNVLYQPITDEDASFEDTVLECHEIAAKALNAAVRVPSVKDTSNLTATEKGNENGKD